MKTVKAWHFVGDTLRDGEALLRDFARRCVLDVVWGTARAKQERRLVAMVHAARRR